MGWNAWHLVLLFQIVDISAESYQYVQSYKLRYLNDVKWCRPIVFIVNFEHPSHLSLVFSIGNFKQVIVCYDIIYTL